MLYYWGSKCTWFDDEGLKENCFKNSICPMLRGGVWPLQQYTVLLLKSHIRSRKCFTWSSLDVEFLGSSPILSSWFLLQVHCLNVVHWQFSYRPAISVDKLCRYIVSSMWFWSISWSTNCPVYFSLFLVNQKKFVQSQGIFGQALIFWSTKFLFGIPKFLFSIH